MLSLLISKVPLAGMILPLFSYRMDIRCFLSGLGRARRCAVLNYYSISGIILRKYMNYAIFFFKFCYYIK